MQMDIIRDTDSPSLATYCGALCFLLRIRLLNRQASAHVRLYLVVDMSVRGVCISVACLMHEAALRFITLPDRWVILSYKYQSS